MRILVDGDASPQINEISILTKKYHKELIVYSDTHHMHQGDYQIIICDQGRDSVDHKIINDVRSGDLVITQDYGLASYVLLKNAYVLHVSGKMINQDNIDALLMQRYLGVKERKANKHIKGPKKRTKETEIFFTQQLENILRGENNEKIYIL